MPLSPESFTRRIIQQVLARLACLIHAANVHSEPGSNPSNDCLNRTLRRTPKRTPKHLIFSMKLSIPCPLNLETDSEKYAPKSTAEAAQRTPCTLASGCTFCLQISPSLIASEPAHYPHPIQTTEAVQHRIRMPRAKHVYKKTRSLTHDLKPNPYLPKANKETT